LLRPAQLSCTKPDKIEYGSATYPIFGGVGDVEGEDLVVVGVPQDEGGRSTVTPQELSSRVHL